MHRELIYERGAQELPYLQFQSANNDLNQLCFQIGYRNFFQFSARFQLQFQEMGGRLM